MSDSKGGWYNERGLEVLALAEAKDRGAHLPERTITNEKLLELPVDLLVPAALENQITKENAGRVAAHFVLEMANAPTTTEADEVLERRQVPVIPDILANAGGVAVSYLEWVQNRTGYYWGREEVAAKLKKLMVEAAAKVFAVSAKKNIPLRSAALLIALKRLARAHELRHVS